MKQTTLLCAALLLAACQPGADAGAGGDADNDATRSEAEALADTIRGVTGGTEDTAASGACSLMKLREVRVFLPDAAPGKPHSGARSLGIDGCEWTGSGGPVGVQTWRWTEGTAEDGMKFRLLGFVDEFNSPALKVMRIEPVAGVGEEAVAVVERANASPGMTSAPALMIARKGQTMALLQMPSAMAQGDRAQVIAKLSGQMRTVLARLP